MRILVKRAIAIGDVLWTTPVIAALRRHHPAAHIAVATARPEIFRGNPHVSELLPADAGHHGYDRVIDLNGAYERRRHLHLAAAYAAEAGVALAEPWPRLYPAPDDFAAAAARLDATGWAAAGIRHVVCVHMAATSPDRIWPASHWRAFLEGLLADPHVAVVALGSANDLGLGAAAGADGLGRRLLDLVRRCSLHHTAALLALADLLVAPDSGLSHVAAAMGTRSVVLYGMTDPAKRLPFAGTAEAVSTPLDCRGCYDAMPADALPLCPKADARCYDAIPPQTVLAAARRALAAAATGPAWPLKRALAAG